MVEASRKVFLCKREHFLGVVVSTCDAYSHHIASLSGGFELTVAEQIDGNIWVLGDTMK